MKGIVFTEFLDMVETSYGLETVDTLIENSKLPSGGAYTAVGNYDFDELLQMLGQLGKLTKIPNDELLFTFGKHLFKGLMKAHPQIVDSYKNPLNLLCAVEDHIHVQVKKIYPDAELPSFNILERTKNSVTLLYRSSRGLHALGHGLIERAFEHFQKKVTVTIQLLNEQGTEVKFTVVQNG